MFLQRICEPILGQCCFLFPLKTKRFQKMFSEIINLQPWSEIVYDGILV